MEYLYTGMFDDGDNVSLLRNLVVRGDKGTVFKNASGEQREFKKGTIATIIKKDGQSMTTPDSFVTYYISIGEDRIDDVPEHFLALGGKG